MANIITNVAFPIKDGVSFTFHAPCNCSDVDGLTVQHPEGETRFVFKDAHGNDLTGINNLFAQGSLIKVVLDVTNNAAFLQNADTNGYLERQIGVERARIDEMVALRTTGAGTYEYQDNVLDVNVKITTSGAVANLIVTATDLMLGPGETFTFTKIPVAFAPMATQTFNEGFDDSIVVILNESVQNDFVPLTIANTSSQQVSVGGFASVTYPLASISVAELVDARVAVNPNGSTTTYPTAGQAIREQVFGLHNRVGLLTNRVVNLEKNGAGGGTGGGAGVLVVTVDGDGIASHTSQQIWEHFQGGGVVLFDADSDDSFDVYQLVGCDMGQALFTQMYDDACAYYARIYEDGTCELGSFEFVTLDTFPGALVVSVDRTSEDNDSGGTIGKANVSASVIYQHIQNGGTAVMTLDGTNFGLISCDDSEAVFGLSWYDDSSAVYYVVGTNCDVAYYEQQYAPFNMLGDINTALDAILDIQASLIGKIAFAITWANTPVVYNAHKGMTWAEWCDSPYNTGGYYVNGDSVQNEVGDNVGLSEGNKVRPADEIVDGATYVGDL